MTGRALRSLAFVLLCSTAADAQSQNPLDAARDLYASAAFEEALNALSRIEPNAGTPAPLAREVDEYRMFSLFALGRTSDAEAVAETLIKREPFTGLQSAEASPRIQSMYKAVRTRLLPQIVREQYRAGRAALDAKSSAEAAQHFTNARRLIAEARALGSTDGGLDDLGDLVDGFLLLATSTSAAPATTADVAPAAAVPAKPVSAAPAAASTSDGGRVYSIADADVTPPAALQQMIPSLPPPLRVYTQPGARPLIVNLTIDETGRVRRSSVVVSVNTAYDNFILAAVAQWRYRPATKGTLAVPYEKVIAIR